MNRLAAFMVGEGNWLPLAMSVAFIAAAWLHYSRRASGAPQRQRILAVMNRFTGVTLLVMGIGHVLAVTVKNSAGTLNGSPFLLYAIGAAVLLPAALIVVNAGHRSAGWLNGWMAATLVVLGLVNIPLAIPPLLNIAYSRYSRPAIGSVIVAAAVVINLGLLAGGLMFMLSGARTFEEFTRGVQ